MREVVLKIKCSEDKLLEISKRDIFWDILFKDHIVLLYLHLFVSNISQMGTIGCFGRILGVDVQILEEDCLGECRPEEN